MNTCRCEEAIRVSEQSIRDTAISLIQDIRTREKQMVEELHAVYGPECMEYMEGKKELAVQVSFVVSPRHRTLCLSWTISISVSLRPTYLAFAARVIF